MTWVGHPMMDAAPVDALRAAAEPPSAGLNPWRRTVGLLPGSRPREVSRHLPVMLAAAARLAWRMPGVQFLLLKAPGVPETLIESHVRRAAIDVRIVSGAAPAALAQLDAAVVASGTATLETALAEIPMVVVYKTSWPTYLAAKMVLRIPRFALVNVVAERNLVPELLQHHATPARIAEALIELLRNQEKADAIREGLREVKQRLGPPGAVERAARAVTECLQVFNRSSAARVPAGSPDRS